MLVLRYAGRNRRNLRQAGSKHCDHDHDERASFPKEKNSGGGTPEQQRPSPAGLLVRLLSNPWKKIARIFQGLEKAAQKSSKAWKTAEGAGPSAVVGITLGEFAQQLVGAVLGAQPPIAFRPPAQTVGGQLRIVEKHRDGGV